MGEDQRPWVSIITAIIGSGIVGFIGTTSYSNFNQPNIALSLMYNVTSQTLPINNDSPQVNYYEVLAKNDGSAQATNVTLSMLFSGNATARAELHGKNLPVKTEILRNDPKQSLVTAFLTKLSREAMVAIYVRTDSSHIRDSYYVSATYDQGSNDISNINEKDIKSGSFPNIKAVHTDIPFDIKIIILAGVIAAICFAVAISQRLGKLQKTKEVLLAYPVPILGAIIVLVIVEELGMQLYRFVNYTSIIPPLDLACPIIAASKIYCVGGRESSVSDANWDTWFLFFIILIARSLVGYSIARLANSLKSHPANILFILKTQWPFGDRQQLKLFALSIVIVGLPIEYLIRWVFSQFLVYYYSSFYLSLGILAIDIIRMSFLALFVAERIIKRIGPFIGKPTIAINMPNMSLNARFSIPDGLIKIQTSAFLMSYGGNLQLDNCDKNGIEDPKKFGPLLSESQDIEKTRVGTQNSVKLGPPTVVAANNSKLASSITYENVVLHVHQNSADILTNNYGKVNASLSLSTNKKTFIQSPKEEIIFIVKNKGNQSLTFTTSSVNLKLEIKYRQNNVTNTKNIHWKIKKLDPPRWDPGDRSEICKWDKRLTIGEEREIEAKTGDYVATITVGSICAGTDFKII